MSTIKIKTRYVFMFVAMAGLLFLSGCTDELAPRHIEDQDEWSEDIVVSLTENTMTTNEALKRLDEAGGEVDDETFSETLEVVLYSLEYDAQRYNETLNNLFVEVNAAFSDNEDFSFESDEGWDDIDSPILEGFKEEVDNKPLIWVETHDRTELGVDYESIQSSYGDYLTQDVENKLTLSKHVREYPDFQHETGTLAFENIWDRIELIESFRDEDGELEHSIKSNLVYYTTMLYGFGESSMEREDGTLNMDALSDMKVLYEANEDHERAEELKIVIDKLEEEEAYTDDVMDTVNELIVERFESFFDDIDESSGEEIVEDEFEEPFEEDFEEVEED